MMERKKLLLVVNPVAGRIKISNSFFDVVKTFSQHGYLVDVRMTSRSGEAIDIVAEQAENYDLVVACGGDGTLNEAVGGLMRSGRDIPLGYIPCGTTNDFAAGLGLEREDMVRCAENIAMGKPFAIDVGLFGDDRYFNYIASFGAFTDTSYSVSQTTKNALGHLAYVVEGLKTITNIKPIHARVTMDGLTLEDDYIFASVTNATSIGGLVKIDSDKVDFSDGQFEVMLVPNPKTAVEISKLILATQTGKYEDSCVTFHHTDKAVFETSEPTAWAIDGEFGDGGTRTEISVVPKAFRIII